MKKTVLALSGVILVTSTCNVLGQHDSTVLVEHSSTVLTATFDGQPVHVELLAPNMWEAYVGGPGPIVSGGSGWWADPDTPGLVTMIEAMSDASLLIWSDLPAIPYVPTHTNGTTVVDGIGYLDLTTLELNQWNVSYGDLTFYDATSAPDTTSSVSLLLFSFAALGLATRTQKRPQRRQ